MGPPPVTAHPRANWLPGVIEEYAARKSRLKPIKKAVFARPVETTASTVESVAQAQTK